MPVGRVVIASSIPYMCDFHFLSFFQSLSSSVLLKKKEIETGSHSVTQAEVRRHDPGSQQPQHPGLG